MFRISPIGSCRIATPLRLSCDAYGFELNFDQIYGYCHSSAEAVQLVKFLKGEISFDDRVRPLISRRSFAPEEIGQKHETSHLYVIELSSSKVLRIGSNAVQLNYVSSVYQAFFSDRARAAGYWAAVDLGDQGEIDAFLAQHWAKTADGATECETLRLIRRSQTTEDELRADVRYLMGALPETLFVTHVDAVTLEGQSIPSRKKFIEMVNRVVGEEGGKVYDPTTAMLRIGQREAIEDYSDSLAHFTDMFSRIVFDEWYQGFIAGQLEQLAQAGGQRAVADILTPHVEARIAVGPSAQFTEWLAGIANRLTDRKEIDALLASTYAAAGKIEAAANIFERLIGVVDGPDQKRALAGLIRHCLDARTGTRLVTAYQRLATAGKPADLPQMLEAAQAFRDAGDAETAFQLILMAFKRNGRDRNLAEQLATLARGYEPQWLLQAEPSVIEALLPKLSAVSYLWLTLARGDLVAARGLLASVSGVSALEAAELADLLFNHALYEESAGLIAKWRTDNPEAANGAVSTHKALAARWHDVATQAADRDTEITLLKLVELADPLHRECRIRLREITRDLLGEMREAGNAGEVAVLDHLRISLIKMGLPTKDLDVARLRVLFANDDIERVLTLARALVAEQPSLVLGWLFMMRAGRKLNDHLAVVEAAQKIIALADDDMERLVTEARERLETAPSVCFRAAKKEADPLVAIKLYAVAQTADDLSKASEDGMRRQDALLVAKVRALETDAAGNWIDYVKEAVKVRPQNERVRLCLARHLTKTRQFADATEHWQYLHNRNPADTGHAFQLERCLTRASSGTG